MFTESHLPKMGKSDGFCKICNTKVEILSHLLYDCSVVQKVWQKVNVALSLWCNVKQNIGYENVLLGIDIQERKVVNQFVNFIIMETIGQIWKNRNNEKYGNK